MADFDFEAGKLVGLGYNFALESGFGGEVGVEDMKKTEMKAGAEVESGSVRETGWCPLCFSGH